MELSSLPNRMRSILVEPAVFMCNVCGNPSVSSKGRITREAPSCLSCGSTVRFRSIIDALSFRMFGKSIPIAKFAKLERKKGIGLSDWDGYANRLAAVCDYRNTFYNRAPKLNICDLSSFSQSELGTFDFLISSDVFEHVAPPVSRAFESAYRLLKPNGVMVFTVPFVLEGQTREHFPLLNDWKLVGDPPHARLENTTTDGTREVFSDLVFHGGEGFTLEMRLFSLSSILAELESAGFYQIRLHGGPSLRYGIEHKNGLSFPITAARKPNV